MDALIFLKLPIEENLHILFSFSHSQIIKISVRKTHCISQNHENNSKNNLPIKFLGEWKNNEF